MAYKLYRDWGAGGQIFRDQRIRKVHRACPSLDHPPIRIWGTYTSIRGKLPHEPIFNYHLGMAYLKKGEKELAREHIEAALKANKPFQGRENAEKILASLSN